MRVCRAVNLHCSTWGRRKYPARCEALPRQGTDKVQSHAEITEPPGIHRILAGNVTKEMENVDSSCSFGPRRAGYGGGLVLRDPGDGIRGADSENWRIGATYRF
ncbi:protein of unknown function [Burkholderia multivorans]